jgi:hypothetical protein
MRFRVMNWLFRLPVRRVTSEELSTTVPAGLHKPAGAAVGNSGVNQTSERQKYSPFYPQIIRCQIEMLGWFFSRKFNPRNPRQSVAQKRNFPISF